MQTRMTGNGFRTTMLCIDSYEHDVLAGRIYHPQLAGQERFGSLMEFLLQMEALLDQMHFPQSFMEKRAFAPAVRTPGAATERGAPEGKLATFAVRVLFRQNASWQGSVLWMEDGREESFRSVLELLLLVHSALTGISADGKEEND